MAVSEDGEEGRLAVATTFEAGLRHQLPRATKQNGNGKSGSAYTMRVEDLKTWLRGAEAKNKRLVRARQVSSNWGVSQVYAFSFIALISVSTVQLLLLLALKLNVKVCIHQFFHADWSIT